MKKVLGLAFGLILGAATYAQAPVTFTDASETWDPASTTVFHFDFDATVTTDAITEAANSCTDYFTVETAAAGEGTTVTITLTADEAMNRMVVGRFLSAATNGADQVNVEGSDMDVRLFVDEYLIAG